MKKITVLLVLVFLTSAFSYGQTILIRPDAGIGYLFADDIGEWTTYYGLKIHLSANEFQRYGIIVNHLFSPINDQVSYLCTGLMIEQVLFNYFNMGIGTIGYINLVQIGENPFGLYTHLGFEYKFSRHFNVMASYRSDFIFRRHFAMYNAFQLGFSIQF